MKNHFFNKKNQSKNIKSNRNSYLDFIKGIATANIIFIHTAFWSGESYVPEIVKSLTLCLDVPFFFFCSGWGESLHPSFRKSLLSLLRLWKRYVVFLLFYFCCLLIFGLITNDFSGITITNFYHNLFFLRTENTALRTVMGSMWFMPVYYTVVPIGALVISQIYKVTKKDEYEFEHLCQIACIFTGAGLLYSYLTGSFFNFSSQTLVYLFFYFLGAACKNIKIKHLYSVLFYICIAFVIIKVLATYYVADELSNMQAMKFPPNIIWVIYSTCTIVIALYAKTKLSNISENNFFCWMGRSALYFYFCQGISSSLLMYIIPYIKLVWFVKLPIAYMINFVMALIFVFILKKVYSVLPRRSGNAI